jgi:hypothetical protein
MFIRNDEKRSVQDDALGVSYPKDKIGFYAGINRKKIPFREQIKTPRVC